MQLNYKGMNEEDVLPLRKSWQDRIDRERLKGISGAGTKKDLEKLASRQIKLQKDLVADWWNLADKIVAKWNDARRQSGVIIMAAGGGTSIGYPEEWAEMIGFNQDIHPIWVERARSPPAGLSDVVTPRAHLPY